MASLDEKDFDPALVQQMAREITPIETDLRLRDVLGEDFKECIDLPISGGWGYTQDSAIEFEPTLLPEDFVSLEYLIAQKIVYEETIVFQPDGRTFSGIDLQFQSQELA